MRCPFCNSDDTRVIDSRLADHGDSVRRRRECRECEERFTTTESAQLRLPPIVKTDGQRENFDEAKLRRGIERALEKRPVGTNLIEAAVQRILRQIMKSGERELSSRHVGEWVMQELRDLDDVAYVRFASVYHRFQDLDAFSKTVNRLKSEPTVQHRRRQLSFLPKVEE